MTTEYSILVVGGNFVGKTSFTMMLVQESFVEEYDPTISESYRKLFTVDEKQVLLNINDVSGVSTVNKLYLLYEKKGESQHMRTILYKNCQMGVILYSIIDEKSLEEARKLYREIQNQRESNKQDPMPIALFGNKNDQEEQRKINTEQGAELAASLNCPFFEGSVKANINLSETMQQLVRLRWQYEAQDNKNKKNKRKGCIIS